MARYYYRSWRGRGHTNGPTKYQVLSSLLGGAVWDIRNAFLQCGPDALDNLLSDYGSIHGKSAEIYARKTYPKWKTGATGLSGQTLERLIELVPPYLEPAQRHDILLKILSKHRGGNLPQTIRVNIKEPIAGFKEIDNALAKLKITDPLAFIPERTMTAARWLYDDDMTAARSMVAEVAKHETEILRSNAVREIALLRRAIANGQVSTASYSVKTPAGDLSVVAYSPSKCFVASTCFGEQAPETAVLRTWRDNNLIHHRFGRSFIVWYYTHGEMIANLVERSMFLKVLSRAGIRLIIKLIIEKERSVE